MDVVWSELGFGGGETTIKVLLRLTAAGLFAAILGWERERGPHQAGLRTHILVGLGAALFALVPAFQPHPTDYSNIVKGLAAGIGFLGGGAILKDVQRQSVEGLTTAASIWLTAAVGLAAAAGMYLAAFAAALMGVFVLRPLQKIASEPPKEVQKP